MQERVSKRSVVCSQDKAASVSCSLPLPADHTAPDSVFGDYKAACSLGQILVKALLSCDAAHLLVRLCCFQLSWEANGAGIADWRIMQQIKSPVTKSEDCDVFSMPRCGSSGGTGAFSHAVSL
jgi:hypothetical protein